MGKEELLVLLTGIVNDCLLSLPSSIHPDHPDECMKAGYIEMNSLMLALWQEVGGDFIKKAETSGWKAAVEDINEEYFLILKPPTPPDDKTAGMDFGNIERFGPFDDPVGSGRRNHALYNVPLLPNVCRVSG